MIKKHQKRIYSEAFKKEKIALWEQEKVRPCELIRFHGMSTSTLYKWRKQYGTIPLSDFMVVEKESEYIKNIELTKQVEDLENMVGRQQMKLDYFKKVITQANTLYNGDIEKKCSQR